MFFIFKQLWRSLSSDKMKKEKQTEALTFRFCCSGDFLHQKCHFTFDGFKKVSRVFGWRLNFSSRPGTGPKIFGLGAVSGILLRARACVGLLEKRAWANRMCEIIKALLEPSISHIASQKACCLCQDLSLGSIGYWAYLL